MKLTTILLLVGVLHLSAASYSQTVTISGKNKSLESVFKDIKQQTGYLFFYSEKVNIKGKTVDADFHDTQLVDVLSACLKNFDLSFTIVSKTIVIQNKIPEPRTEPVTINKVSVSGRVLDSVSKTTLPGVNIAVKGVGE
ncbi:hypothetical protein ACRQ5D_23870 [Mucilaginibacter sp. P25]|uniref:hypothetical protein n=1 Tax=unclassified Mucilaginibacter TaxID=2617802 RepID=UPI003D66EE66